MKTTGLTWEHAKNLLVTGMAPVIQYETTCLAFFFMDQGVLMQQYGNDPPFKDIGERIPESTFTVIHGTVRGSKGPIREHKVKH